MGGAGERLGGGGSFHASLLINAFCSCIPGALGSPNPSSSIPPCHFAQFLPSPQPDHGVYVGSKTVPPGGGRGMKFEKLVGAMHTIQVMDTLEVLTSPLQNSFMSQNWTCTHTFIQIKILLKKTVPPWVHIPGAWHEAGTHGPWVSVLRGTSTKNISHCVKQL